MYGKSNVGTYITMCKIDSQWEFAVWLREHKQGLCDNLEGWDGEGDGRKVWEEGLGGRFKSEGIYVHLDNHDGVITNLEPDILECEVKWDLESITVA